MTAIPFVGPISFFLGYFGAFNVGIWIDDFQGFGSWIVTGILMMVVTLAHDDLFWKR